MNYISLLISGCSSGCSIKRPGTRKNVLLWLVPFALAPLPTLMLFVLFCGVKVK